jgi:N-sulfoglucosamine sulfohydrolase
MVNNAMINWADLTPTILDLVGVDHSSYGFHGRSFKNVLDQTNPVGWDEIYASHTFHEITMYYPMRVCQERRYKLIWNLAWRLEYPFSSDLWASSTWQSIYRNKVEMFGKRKVSDYLFRAEFELYDLLNDPNEIHNLAGDKAYSSILETMKQKIKTFQIKTSDPWYLLWNHESTLKRNGVNL